MPGRNDPCPCGSGRKYKYCCLNHPVSGESSGALPGTPPRFDNEYPVPQFLGLTPGEFERLGFHFFDSRRDIRVADRVETHPSGAMVTVLDTLIDLVPLACKEEGWLPENVISAIMKRLRKLPEYSGIMAYSEGAEGLGLKLMMTALVALVCGDVLRWDGRAYVLGPKCRREAEAGDYRSIYPHLFRTFVEEVPWTVPVPEEEEGSPLEVFFGYTLFQLSRWGGEEHLAAEYAWQFFDAVPMGRDQLQNEGEGRLAATSTYVAEVIFGLWAMFGLVEIDFDEQFGPAIRARPILRELIRFPDAWLERDLGDYSVFDGADWDEDWDEDWDDDEGWDDDEDWDDVERGTRLPPVDFDGLSPDSMHELIYKPFDAPDVVTFAGELGGSHSAPVLTVLDEVMKAIDAGEKIGPTATGAFSRAFTRHMAPLLMSDHTYDLLFRMQLPSKEMDVFALHVSRLLLEMAGIVRTYKKRFIIAQKYRSVLKAKGATGVYPQLFRVAAEKYDWAYADGYPSQPLIQQFFGFSLRTLSRYGDTPRPNVFYSDAFARAFPTVLDEDWGAWAHTHRTFGHFAWLMGLVTVSRPERDWQAPDIFESTPLLRAFIQFHV